MDSINSNMGMGPELYAMKKAIDVQGQGVMKVLESATASTGTTTSGSGSSATGLGQLLDIKA